MTASSPDLLTHYDALPQRYRALKKELGKVIIGQEAIVDQLLVALFSQGHVLIVGVPGLAKTLLVRSLARALDLEFRRIQFTPDLMPADILGSEILQTDPATGERLLRFVPGPIFGHLILADEINRTPPRTQAAVLEAMGEHQVTLGGRTLPLESPFLVIATQNPIEQTGTYPLPEAALDRFMLSLWMDYPTRGEEEQIVAQAPQEREAMIQPVFTREELGRTVAAAAQAPVAEHVVQYAVALARATRPQDPEAGKSVRQYVQWGAGPRAGQCLLAGAKVLAALEGQPTPARRHVAAMAMSVLRHRLVLNFIAGSAGVTPQAVVEGVLQHMPAQ